MNHIKMNQFGQILTGRDFGRKVMRELEEVLEYPAALDFSDTVSLGSSFGDEVVPVIAKKQGGEILVLNPNKAVWACLTKIAADHNITVRKG